MRPATCSSDTNGILVKKRNMRLCEQLFDALEEKARSIDVTSLPALLLANATAL